MVTSLLHDHNPHVKAFKCVVDKLSRPERRVIIQATTDEVTGTDRVEGEEIVRWTGEFDNGRGR